jgi:hypothetical protein
VIVPGTVDWRQPLDRPRGERKMDPATGERTGEKKKSNRKKKAIADVKSAGDRVGAWGRVRFDPQFWLAVQDLMDNIRSYNWDRDTYFQRVINVDGIEEEFPEKELLRMKKIIADANNAKMDQEGFDRLIREGVTNDRPLAEAIARHASQRVGEVGWQGLPISVIPTAEEKKKAIKKGKFKHRMRNTAFVLHDGKLVFKYNKRGDFHECIGATKTVFTPGERLGITNPIEGVTFGLEICLDHGLGMLKASVGEGGNLPDIHILISDGAGHTPGNIQATRYFLHAECKRGWTKVLEAPDWTKPADSDKLPEDTLGGDSIMYWKLTI